jgi:hypothetical protein
MAAVIFDVTTFKERYPEFTSVSDTKLEALFVEATLYLSNTDNPIKSETRRAILLNMLVAHLATIYGTIAVDGTPKEPGRITSATEGSVTINYEENFLPGTAAWYAQSQYGAAFWRATTAIRGFRYIKQPTVY